MFNVYNPQASIDRINNQIAELEKMKQSIPQAPMPTNLTQNFQLAPTNNNVLKFANSIDEVQKSIVIGDTPFFSNDMSVLWIKNTKNEIKTYELKEIVPLDEKDLQIQYLQAEIDELKKGLNKNEFNTTNSNDDATKDTTNTSGNDESVRTTIKKNKSSSI